MAHAQFHKNQRVYVRPVGTWAMIERVVPYWTKGIDSPIRIFYDVGLGREFSAEELQSDNALAADEGGTENWRVVRAPNKLQSASESMNHPFPGTYPIVMTGEADWGGWRVPAAEYALTPSRTELQARMIAMTPRLAAVAKALSDWAKAPPGKIPAALADAVRMAKDALGYIDEK